MKRSGNSVATARVPWTVPATSAWAAEVRSLPTQKTWGTGKPSSSPTGAVGPACVESREAPGGFDGRDEGMYVHAQDLRYGLAVGGLGGGKEPAVVLGHHGPTRQTYGASEATASRTAAATLG